MRRILAVLGVGMAMSGTANAQEQAQDGFYGKYETPAYDVVRNVGDAQLRRYAPHLLAQVTVRGDQSRALGQGFRALAGYIFGGNDGGASVAMTSPVTQSANIAMTSPVTQSGGDGLWTVTFMMPRDYTIDSLPAPNNDAVQFVQVPPKTMLVLEFSGRTPTRTLEARSTELAQIAQDAGIAVIPDPVFMFYDDPFTLPFQRRNEVAFEVE